MRLKADARDRLLEEFSSRLNGGAIVIYPANPETSLAEPLVEIAFQSPAFHPVENGRVEAHDLAMTLVLRTGEARWAEFVTASGEAIADAFVRAEDDPNAADGDVLLDRTDFHRGGPCTLTRVTLSLPLQP